MLKSLSVQNFSLIDNIDLKLEDGLTVITGETGAGKSILLGALSLILGERVKHDALKDKAKKCIVEGEFELKDFRIQQLFDDFDLDYEELIVFRREVTPLGKSRNFINDTPTTIDVMKRIGRELIDIHSQHQSLKINDKNFQLDILDSLASNKKAVEDYYKKYQAFQQVKKKLLEKKEYAGNSKKQEDYLLFQLNEIDALALEVGEIEELESEQQFFANREEVVHHFKLIEHIVSAEGGNLLGQFNQIDSSIASLQAHLTKMEEIKKRFDSLKIELDDLVREIESYESNFQFDPDRQRFVEERLTEIHHLQRKHGFETTNQLVKFRADLEKELNNIAHVDEEIKQLEQAVEEQEKQLYKDASEISKKRLAVIQKFETELQNILKELGMPNIEFKIDHLRKETIDSSGIDEFEFLFSANKGLPLKKISSTASGGEISRLMLGIKLILAEHKRLPCIIFDEIDTGVSGEIADKMGSMLEQLGVNCQVLSITHLPQIAAKGENHILVYKEEKENITRTSLRKLSGDDRISEMAKMLSGEKLSEAAINNARELLSM